MRSARRSRAIQQTRAKSRRRRARRQSQITMTRFHLKLLLAAIVACCCVPAPAAAQVDLAGQWATRMHEDQLERGGGPEVGEYQGLPINDADRLRADSW